VQKLREQVQSSSHAPLTYATTPTNDGVLMEVDLSPTTPLVPRTKLSETRTVGSNKSRAFSTHGSIPSDAPSSHGTHTVFSSSVRTPKTAPAAPRTTTGSLEPSLQYCQQNDHSSEQRKKRARPLNSSAKISEILLEEEDCPTHYRLLSKRNEAEFPDET
jgi:hypothetical protein